MLLEDLKPCTRMIDSNANASNLKEEQNEILFGVYEHVQ